MRNKRTDYSKIEEILIGADVGERQHEGRVQNRIISQIASGQIEPENKGKQKKIYKMSRRFAAAVLIACALGLFSMTAFAQGIIHTVLAYFEIGNFEIVQYDVLPDYDAAPSDSAGRSPDNSAKSVSLEEAYKAMGKEFALPTRLPKGFQYVGCLSYGDTMVSVQYRSDDDQLGFLITNYHKGDPNGIETTEEIETKEIGGTTVYFVNGIVIWNVGDLRYELYWANYDMASIREIITSLDIIK